MQKLKSIIAKWPWLWMAFVLLCVAAYFLLRFFLPPYEFIPPIVAALGSIAFVLFWHLSTRRNIQQYVVEMGMSLDKGLSQKMDSLALPYVMLDDKGRLLWKNSAFRNMLKENGRPDQLKAADIKELFPDIRIGDKAADGTPSFKSGGYVSLGNRIFAVRQQPGEEGGLTALLFIDETEHVAVKETLEKERGVAGILYIDNYEELLKHTEVNEHSLLGALIEQQIQKYFQPVHGIVCKTERDRFYVFMNHEGLGRCMEDRFSLLNQVREIKAGNTIPVTVSIAFGQVGKD